MKEIKLELKSLKSDILDGMVEEMEKRGVSLLNAILKRLLMPSVVSKK